MQDTTYPAPRLIFWESTAGCNLECIHCRRITVADIVTVVEAGEAEPESLSASDLGQRVMAPFWAEHEQAMLARLDAITIEDLCHAAEQSAVRREIKDGIDFAI